MRWWLSFSDVSQIKQHAANPENSSAWSPPPLIMRNAKEDQKIETGDSQLTFFPKKQQWWGQQVTQISCTFMESMELQNCKQITLLWYQISSWLLVKNTCY